MSSNTITMRGKFTGTGSAVFIPLRSGVTWMNVYNTTQISAASNGVEYQWYWQEGMPAQSGIGYAFVGATGTYPEYFNGTAGFTLIDTSLAIPGSINATVTAVSTASIPVVTNSGTNGLVPGDVVTMINVAGAQQLGGIHFTVGYNTLSNTTFSLDYMSQLAAAGTTGSWVKVAFDPIYYPRRRYITKISKAAQAVVTLSVTHGYKVGQIVRMHVPVEFGMVEINNLQATIVAINTNTSSGNTITLDIDSSSFTAFAFPATAVYPFTPAQVVPLGEDTPFAIAEETNILSDATVNQAEIGMLLSGGATGPAGQASDVIYWTAGTAFDVNNQ